MKCPYCGSEEGYYETEKVHRALCYTFDGEPDGASEDYNDWDLFEALQAANEAL